tara:strand:- start:154 stop:786 length:633 start_codon:yes stop_codon:yes gene_type:complete
LKYKKYFRKTSLKQKGVGDFFLQEILKKKPKKFLEIGVFHGVTARNICELLDLIHKGDFTYIGIDLFNEKKENEIIPNVNFTNPLKKIYFKYILRKNPYTKEAVENLLAKFKSKINLIKGDTNEVLQTLNLENIDYVFLDGGHDYETVKNDLSFCKKILDNNGTVLCDDYNLSYAPGVKKAVDEFVNRNNYNCELLWNTRFAKIEKLSLI